MKNLVLLVFVLFVSIINAQEVHFLSGTKEDTTGANFEFIEQYIVFNFEESKYYIEYKEEEFFVFDIVELEQSDSGKKIEMEMKNSKGKSIRLVNYYEEVDVCYVTIGGVIYTGICRYAEKE